MLLLFQKKGNFQNIFSEISRYFHGDLTGEDATKLLANSPSGTFLLRFSSSGDLAASYIAENNEVKHSLIHKENGKFTVGSLNGESIQFSSIKEFVSAYQAQGTFKTPYRNMSSIFIEERPARNQHRSNPTEYVPLSLISKLLE